MIIWKEVESKGLAWIVGSDCTIKSSAHECTYTRERNGKKQTFTTQYGERVLSQCVNHSGYLEVAAMKNGKRIKHSVHRLIGMAFVDGYEPSLSINHIDGNKLNNDPSNLEWVSLARNTQHQWEIGLVDMRGEKSPNARLTSRQVVYIRRLLAQGISAHTLSVISGMSAAMIYHIRDGKRWPTVTGRKSVIEHVHLWPLDNSRDANQNPSIVPTSDLCQSFITKLTDSSSRKTSR